MAVTPVQIVRGTYSGAGVLSVSANVTSAPQAGDVVVAIYMASSTQGTPFNCTGLGATWSQAYYTTRAGLPGQNTGNVGIWIGTGATSTGNVTVSWASTGTGGTLTVYLLRGLPVAGFTVDQTYVQGDVSTSPSMTVAANQFVIDQYYLSDTGSAAPSFPATQTPAAGWVTPQAVYRDIIRGYFNTAYRITGGSETVQVTADPAGTSNRNQWHTQIVIGVVANVDATLTATLPAVTTSGLTATMRVSGSLSGSTPALTGSLFATPTITASLDGLTPALTGSLAATQRITGALSGQTPAVTGALSAAAIISAELTGQTAPAFGSLTATVSILATLSGQTPDVVGDLTATVTITGILDGQTQPVDGNFEALLISPEASLSGITPAVVGAFVAQVLANIGRPAEHPRVTVVVVDADATVPPTSLTARSTRPYAGTVRVTSRAGTVTLEEA